SSDERWTIAELGAEVSRALEASGYVPPANGQVRAVPDLRTIRYYTSLGLLDRPLEMQGRTALYGRRHLLQLVAIKRLQAEGRSLGEIQAELAALDDRALQAVARVPARAGRGQARAAAGGGGGPARARGAFWRERPGALAAAAAASAPAPAPRARRAAALVQRRAPRAPEEIASELTKLRLASGVELLIEGRAGDVAALVRAAEPLIAELRRQGLVPEGQEEAG